MKINPYITIIQKQQTNIINYKNNNKNNSSDFQVKLREEVKKWLFSQSLENRMKISNVKNELD